MKLKIENFGKIKSANLELEGLTVITGQNDTGKSTVGKILFWVINCLNNYEKSFNDFLISYCKAWMSRTLKYLARKEYKLPEDLNKFIGISDSIPNKLFNETENLTSDVIKFTMQTLNFIKQKNLEEDKVLKEELVFLKKLLNSSEKMKIELILWFDKSKIFKDILNNSVHSDIKANISFETADNKVIEIEISKDTSGIDINFDKDKIKILWSNVDFIETPLMIDKKDYSSSEDKKWIKKFNDVRKKIKDKDSFFISNEIHDIIDGDISISDDDDLYYQKNKTSKKLHIMNAAAGAKSFVVLDLLNKFGNFKSDSITVFDEPENHLHPEWQIKYAELIIDYVQKGANIILASHSPYMIQALIHYAKNRNLAQEKFRLLLSKKEEENWVRLNDVTKTPQKIFELLDKPFYDVLKG